MEYNIYKDMFLMSSFKRKSGLMNCPETLMAVGGGAKYPNLQGFISEVLK